MPVTCSMLYGFLISCESIRWACLTTANRAAHSMKRVEGDQDWPLFCPAEAPGLADVHSEEFETLFLKYEQEGRAKKVVKAQKLWYAILDAQTETGGPFMLYKDAANRKPLVSIDIY